MKRLARVICAGVALTAMLAFAGPAAGQKPSRVVIDLDDPAIEAEFAAFFTEACGTEIDADLSGRIISLVLAKADTGVVALDVFHIEATLTNPETGATFSLLDVGPDVYFARDGKLFVAITGRSLTGSGVIGRVVVDLETGEVVFEAGKPAGNLADAVCEAIA